MAACGHKAGRLLLINGSAVWQLCLEQQELQPSKLSGKTRADHDLEVHAVWVGQVACSGVYCL